MGQAPWSVISKNYFNTIEHVWVKASLFTLLY
jgi:hypothetical protein